MWQFELGGLSAQISCFGQEGPLQLLDNKQLTDGEGLQDQNVLRIYVVCSEYPPPSNVCLVKYTERQRVPVSLFSEVLTIIMYANKSSIEFI